jgi:peptidoglycan/LPS O-acetylase OafA/YrhL
VFFVLSGYLITSLLIAEWKGAQRIGLRAFWARRAKRLLPALAVLLAGLLILASFRSPERLAATRDGALAASAYITNWYLIFHHESYFESFGPPPLMRHLWSLAIEEQFYVAWPPLFALGWRFLGRRGSLAAMLAGALASTALMAWLYHPGDDPSRVYYGTDTRAAGLLVGSAFGVLAAGGNAMPRGRLVPTLAFVLGLAGLAAAFALGHETSDWVYRGGFLAVDAATVLVIGGVVAARAGWCAGLLGKQPLRWLGQRSYGIYLWHWPVVVLTGPGTDLPLRGLTLFAARTGITLTIAALSYAFVEQPVRQGAIQRAWQARRQPRPLRRRLGDLGWVGASACVVGLAISVAGAQTPAPPDYLPVGSVHLRFDGGEPAPPDATPAEAAGSPTPDLAAIPWPTETGPLPVDVATATPTDPPAAAPATEAPPTAAPTPRARPGPRPHGAVLAIGESVMLGAANELGRTLGSVDIDASSGRQMRQTISALEGYAEAGVTPGIVVIQAGDNGRISNGDFDRIMEILADVDRVVFVNLEGDRDWIPGNNEVIAAGVARYANAVLVDWHGASDGHPDLFWDGMHVRPEGAALYADLILEAVAPPTKAAPATPAPPPTATPPASPTATASPSATASPGATASATTTASPAATTTGTGTPTPSSTPSVTPTAVPAGTTAPTIPAQPEPSPSATASPAPVE